MKLGAYEKLLRQVAHAEGLPLVHVRRVLEAFAARLPDAVWGLGRVIWPRVAVFRVRARKSRRIRNPVSGELMTLPRQRVVAARVAGSWRSRV